MDRGIPITTMVRCRVDDAIAGRLARAHLEAMHQRLVQAKNRISELEQQIAAKDIAGRLDFLAT